MDSVSLSRPRWVGARVAAAPPLPPPPPATTPTPVPPRAIDELVRGSPGRKTECSSEPRRGRSGLERDFIVDCLCGVGVGRESFGGRRLRSRTAPEW